MKNQKIKIKLVFYRTLFSQSAASLTMGSMAAFLRQHGFNCDLCLLERQGLHNAEKILQGSEEKIIFAKPNFKDHILLLPLLAELKKQKKVNQIFLCGPYACLNYISMMNKLPWLDGILFGDTEETALDLAKLVVANKKITFRNCPGGVWRKSNDKCYFNFVPRRRKFRLNSLPFPARDIEIMEKGSYANIESSRGCNGECSFCHVPMVSNISGCTSIDYRSPKLVADEMEMIYKTLKKKFFIFNDSCFWRNKFDNVRILEFCNEIKRRKLPIKFYIYLRSHPEMPDEILTALRRAGLARIFLGIENVSTRSQEVLNKKIAINAYESAKKKFDKYDINIHIGYIVAEPYSKLSAIVDNLKYLRTIGKLFRLGTILEPIRVIPGSRFHKRLIEDGLLKSDADFNDITYGYKYKYRESDRFMGGIKDIFDKISDEAYEFEYFCTTAFLLKSLLCQINKAKYVNIAKDFLTLKKMTETAMDDLLDFFLNYINLISAKKDKTTAFNNLKENFLLDFKKNHVAIKVKYSDIINKIKLCHAEEVVNCIYTGLDRIS